MPICGICLEKFPDYTSIVNFPCNFNGCHECVYKWLYQAIESNHLTTNCIRCPFLSCKSFLNIQEITELLPSKKREGLNQLLLKKYLSSEKDMRTCPNYKCNYAGILPSLYCKNKLICEKCGKEWFDKSQADFAPFSFKTISSKVKHACEDYMSQIKELFICQSCPKCKSKIYRNGGCAHVSCYNCHFSFCWICLQSFFNYHHERRFLCGIRFYFRILFLLLLCGGFFIKICSLDDFKEEIPIFTQVLTNNARILSILLICHLILNMMQKLIKSILFKSRYILSSGVKNLKNPEIKLFNCICGHLILFLLSALLSNALEDLIAVQSLELLYMLKEKIYASKLIPEVSLGIELDYKW